MNSKGTFTVSDLKMILAHMAQTENIHDDTVICLDVSSSSADHFLNTAYCTADGHVVLASR